jgi:hypothetical protein
MEESMKSIVVISVLLFTQVSFGAQKSAAKNSAGLDFAAPLVSDKTQITHLVPFGTIVFDEATSSFAGLDSAGSWQSMTTPHSQIRLTQPNGYGSSGTFIRTFSHVDVNNGGSDLSYTSDSVNGDYITVNTAGVYAVDRSDSCQTSTPAIGISKNASGTQLSTAFANPGIPGSEQLTWGVGGNNGSMHVSTVTYLSAADVIRAHDQNLECDAATFNYFNIIRLK